MEKTTPYFDTPVQVAFYDADGDHYVGGIGYHDTVICGCCGGVLTVDEIMEFVPENTAGIIILPWVDISQEIIGDILGAEDDE